MNMELFYQGIKIGLMVAIPIGPIALLCIRKNLQGTLAVGLALALGTATADALYAVIGALSLSSITVFLDKYQSIIELLGIAVIFYLGINTLIHRTPKTTEQDCSAGTLLQTYLSMLLITLTSPMTIVLFAGAFAGIGTNAQLGTASNITPLTLGVFTAVVCWFMLLSALVTFFKNWFTNQHITWINTGAGIIIICFGLQRLITVLAQ